MAAQDTRQPKAGAQANRRWFHRWPGLALLVFVLGLLVLGLLGLELGLRVLGREPTYSYNPIWFQSADTIIPANDYFADSAGVFRISPLGRRRLAERLRLSRQCPPPGCPPDSLPDSLRNTKLLYSLRRVAEDWAPLQPGTDTLHTALDSLLVDLLAAAEERQAAAAAGAYTPDSVWAEQLRSYAQCPVNQQGYRSVAFQAPLPRNRPKVLLLGDSFTWGLSAQPLTASFADRLLASGYAVYNTGIISTDPAQYRALAQRWIPSLQPDAVVVNFYTGNDYMHYYRPLRPGQPPYYPTHTVGWLNAFPYGAYQPTARAAYQRMVEEHQASKSWINRLRSVSVVAERFYGLAGHLGMVQIPGADRFQAQSVAEHYLLGIDSLCRAHGAEFFVAVIPAYQELGNPAALEQKLAFDTLTPGQDFAWPPNLTLEDYRTDPDGHYTNTGHAKHAAFLDSLLRRRLVSRWPQGPPPFPQPPGRASSHANNLGGPH